MRTTFWRFCDTCLESFSGLWNFLATPISMNSFSLDTNGLLIATPIYTTSWLGMLSLTTILGALVMRIIHLYNVLT